MDARTMVEYLDALGRALDASGLLWGVRITLHVTGPRPYLRLDVPTIGPVRVVVGASMWWWDTPRRVVARLDAIDQAVREIAATLCRAVDRQHRRDNVGRWCAP
jgi:hypothetical protein